LNDALIDAVKEGDFSVTGLNLRNTISRFLPLHEVTEEILHHFVERIEVDNNGIPTINYRFSILPG
jgi:hypothetical protein